MWILLAAAALAQSPETREDAPVPPPQPAASNQDSALQELLDQALSGEASEQEPVDLAQALPAPTWETLLERAPLTFSVQIEQPLVVGASEPEWAEGPDLILLPDGTVYWGEVKILDAYFGGSNLLFPPAGNPLGAKLSLSRGPADWEGLPENPGWIATGLIQEEGSFARPLRAVERRPVLTGEEAWEDPPVVVSEQTWAEFQMGRLVVVETAYDADVPWLVRDGMGNAVNTQAFAQLTQDTKAIELLEAERRAAKITGLSVAGGGVVLVGLAAIPVALIDRDLQRPEWGDYESRVQRENYLSDEEYLNAIEVQRGLYVGDLGGYRSDAAKNVDRRWTAAALAGVGVLALSAAPWALDGQLHDREMVADTWSRERADGLIEDYNQALRTDLGIPLDYDPKDVVELPQPTPDPQQQSAGPVETPGEWDEVSVQPDLAPGYVGFTVRF